MDEKRMVIQYSKRGRRISLTKIFSGVPACAVAVLTGSHAFKSLLLSLAFIPLTSDVIMKFIVLYFAVHKFRCSSKTFFSRAR